jgi:hypothetical protein
MAGEKKEAAALCDLPILVQIFLFSDACVGHRDNRRGSHRDDPSCSS